MCLYIISFVIPSLEMKDRKSSGNRDKMIFRFLSASLKLWKGPTTHLVHGRDLQQFRGRDSFLLISVTHKTINVINNFYNFRVVSKNQYNEVKTSTNSN